MENIKKTIPINKEDFVCIIGLIEQQRAKIDKFSDALAVMTDSPYILFDTENAYLTALLLTLNRIFSQEPNAIDNTIEWYLFDNATSKTHMMYYNDIEIDINTPEMLYEFLCAEFDAKENEDSDAIPDFFLKYQSKEKADMEGVEDVENPEDGGADDVHDTV